MPGHVTWVWSWGDHPVALGALPGSRVDGEGRSQISTQFLQIVTLGRHSDYVGNFNLFAKLIKHSTKTPRQI